MADAGAVARRRSGVAPAARALAVLGVLLSALALAGCCVRAEATLPPASAVCSGLEAHACEALVDIYRSTDGKNWRGPKHNWLNGGNPCSPSAPWGTTSTSTASRALECALGNTQLTRLWLRDYYMRGTLPTTVGWLGTQIQYLYLTGHVSSLEGPLPTELFNLTSVQYFSLQSNYALSLTVPSLIGAMTSLRSLFLDNMREGLRGTLPSELASLPQLTSLNLQNSYIEESFESLITKLPPALTSLQLGSASLSGTLPSDAFAPNIGALHLLSSFSLYGSSISGTLPPRWFTDPTRLHSLQLNTNQAMSPPLPSNFTNTLISQLYIQQSGVGGPFPTTWNASRLRFLYLSYNSLTGTLPPSVFSNTSLEYVQVHYNSLSGEIPVEIEQRNIRTFYAQHNRFTGVLPMISASSCNLDAPTDSPDRSQFCCYSSSLTPASDCVEEFESGSTHSVAPCATEFPPYCCPGGSCPPPQPTPAPPPVSEVCSGLPTKICTALVEFYRFGNGKRWSSQTQSNWLNGANPCGTISEYDPDNDDDDDEGTSDSNTWEGIQCLAFDPSKPTPPPSPCSDNCRRDEEGGPTFCCRRRRRRRDEELDDNGDNMDVDDDDDDDDDDGDNDNDDDDDDDAAAASSSSASDSGSDADEYFDADVESLRFELQILDAENDARLHLGTLRERMRYEEPPALDDTTQSPAQYELNEHEEQAARAWEAYAERASLAERRAARELMRQRRRNKRRLKAAVAEAARRRRHRRRRALSRKKRDDEAAEQTLEYRVLYLQNDDARGSLPVSLGDLTDLHYLYVDNSAITHYPLAEVFALPRLRYVYLGDMDLQVTIPTEVGLYPGIELEFSDMSFTGSIPTQIGQMTQIRSLYFNDLFSLQGSVPTEIGNLRTLSRLTMQDLESVSGPVPSELGLLTALTQLTLYDMSLRGPWPTQLYSLTSLRTLSLRHIGDQLQMPAFDLARYPALQTFSMENQGRGVPPQFPISFPSTLTNLDLDYNSIYSTLPTAIGQATALRYLYARSNLLHGVLPTEIGALTQLSVIDVSSNFFNGPVPGYAQTSLSSCNLGTTANVNYCCKSPSLRTNCQTYPTSLPTCTAENVCNAGTTPQPTPLPSPQPTVFPTPEPTPPTPPPTPQPTAYPTPIDFVPTPSPCTRNLRVPDFIDTFAATSNSTTFDLTRTSFTHNGFHHLDVRDAQGVLLARFSYTIDAFFGGSAQPAPQREVEMTVRPLPAHVVSASLLQQSSNGPCGYLPASGEVSVSTPMLTAPNAPYTLAETAELCINYPATAACIDQSLALTPTSRALVTGLCTGEYRASTESFDCPEFEEVFNEQWPALNENLVCRKVYTLPINNEIALAQAVPGIPNNCDWKSNLVQPTAGGGSNNGGSGSNNNGNGSNGNGDDKSWITWAIVGAAAGLLLLACIVFTCWYKRRGSRSAASFAGTGAGGYGGGYGVSSNSSTAALPADIGDPSRKPSKMKKGNRQSSDAASMLSNLENMGGGGAGSTQYVGTGPTNMWS